VSPYIRGFTGFHDLFLIDGVRLNNSVQRPGPNQYWGTVDAYSVERLEVSLGPGGPLYGSDAVGGVAQSFSRSPYGWEADGGIQAHGRALYRFGSADTSSLGRAEASVTYGDGVGLLVGISGKHYDDLRAGGDVGEQLRTDFDEIDGDAKLVLRPRDGDELTLLYQRASQWDAPRTHKTVESESYEGTTIGSELKRNFDQDRDLLYAQYRSSNPLAFVDDLHVNFSWQRMQEERDRRRGNGRRDISGFEVDTLGLFAQLRSETRCGDFVYGFDYYHDFVDSYRTDFNADGSFRSRSIQGPVAGDADYDLFGVYAEWSQLFAERFEVFLGGRFTYAKADASEVADPLSGEALSLEDDWTNFSASLRAVWYARDDLHLYTSISQGFRAPNLSDLTRFDSARTNEIQTPSTDLSDETFLGLEIGAKSRGDRHRASLAAFGMLIYDGLIRTPTGREIDGDQEVQVENVGDGFVTGFEFEAAYKLWRELEFFVNGSYVYGKQDTFPTAAAEQDREYLDRLQPFSGQAGFRWGHSSYPLWAEFDVRFAVEADKLNTRDKSDTDRIPPGGTPAWFTLNLRGGVEVTEYLKFALALENLSDRTYRIHGSGVTAPGVNAKITTEVTF
jgi:hemoglobin/transferrin/lactoferrin receptor protein